MTRFKFVESGKLRVESGKTEKRTENGKLKTET